jgi:hypothetical protein
MGVVKQLHPILISSIELESGTMVYWCDKTFNSIVSRMEKESK